MKETLYEEALNTHCFECGVKLTEENTSVWEQAKQLENTQIIAQVKVCVICAEVNSRMLCGARKIGDEIIPINNKTEILKKVLEECSIESLKKQEISIIAALQNEIIKNPLRLIKK